MSSVGPFRVAFLGLGMMGEALVKNMVSGPIARLSLWNRTASKASALAAQLGGVGDKEGGDSKVVWHSTAEAAVSESDYVFLMLFDAHGTAELLKTLPLSGKIIINHATVSPHDSISLESLVSDLNGTFVECPVLGNPFAIAAKKGTMMIGVGKKGDDWDARAAAKQASPFTGRLEEIAAAVAALTEGTGEVMRIGPVGTAAALKLAANNLIISQLSAFSTSHALASRSGVPESAFAHLVTKPLLAFPYYPAWIDRFESKNYSDKPTFALSGAEKDAKLVVEAAESVGVHASATAGSLAIIQRAIKAGYADGGNDMSAAYEGVLIPPQS